jgi:hypothetical protein
MFVGCPLAVVGYFRISFLRLFHVKNVVGAWVQFSTHPELWMFHTVVQVHMLEQAGMAVFKQTCMVWHGRSMVCEK